MLKQPRISVNKLAEYIVSRGARQRKILSDRKYPNEDFNLGAYHKEAQEAISRYIAAGAISPDPIDRQISSLLQMPTEKVGTARRVNSNIDALEIFSGMLDDIDLKGADPVLGAHQPQPLTYHGVKISVRPEIVLRGTNGRGKKLVGAIKLHLTKSSPMTEESSGYVSAALQEFCKRHLAEDDETVSPDYCQVIDVGSGTIYPGVKSTRQRLKDIEAECQNIAAIWDSI